MKNYDQNGQKFQAAELTSSNPDKGPRHALARYYTHRLLISTSYLLFIALLAFPAFGFTSAPPLKVTLLHTNDLHSHFRPDRSANQLGGIGRIKTQVDQIRMEEVGKSEVFLVDGGDWSEGSIYYTHGLGSESIRMMDAIGYDVAVIGNHDFLNGPDVLMSSLDLARRPAPRMSLVANNIDFRAYTQSETFSNAVQPYVIKNVGPYKIAFIGLTTYEFIYDSYFNPVRITEPFLSTINLARRLKAWRQADAVVVISHNSILANKIILAAANEVDLIIGAHDHVQLEKPVEVTRIGAKPAWIVETGKWGENLGRLDLEISSGKLSLENYSLIPMDNRIAEDPTIVERINQIEGEIEKKFGPIFSAEVATSEIDLTHTAGEDRLGNFVTDAYVRATGADCAIEIDPTIYGELYKGSLRPVDFFNLLPAIYSAETEKTWTLSVLPVKGSVLVKILNILYSSKTGISYGDLSVSGLNFFYKPFLPLNTPNSMLREGQYNELAESNVIQNLKINGKPYEPNRTYQLAIVGSVLIGFQAINKVFPPHRPLIPLDGLRDTGTESWRAVEKYASELSPITAEKITVGDRALPAPDEALPKAKL